MEEEIVFLNIIFRSMSHMVWFMFSMFFLLAVLISTIWFILKKKAFILIGVYVLLAFLHGLASLAAIRATKGGRICNGAFSPDCIWFNELMCGIYIGLCVLYYSIKKYLKRSGSKKSKPFR